MVDKRQIVLTLLDLESIVSCCKTDIRNINKQLNQLKKYPDSNWRNSELIRLNIKKRKRKAELDKAKKEMDTLSKRYGIKVCIE